MNKISISDKFDGGNIQVVSANDADNIQLNIRKDNSSDFFQWFYFRLDGQVGKKYCINIINADQAAFPSAWPGYNVCTSWDRQDWFRTDTQYSDGVLSFEIELSQNSVYFSYFAPYSHERHLDLLSWAQQDERVSSEVLGETLDGRSMSLLTIGKHANDTRAKSKHKVWLIARQHPGETMAEWFIEGTLNALLDTNNPLASKLLETTTFYIVPNMNPDGAYRGNLRTNASGANLNREWNSPSMATSPEVFLVRDRMLKEGGNIFLDIHGDEELPYNFVAGCEGNPNYSAKISGLENTFKSAFMATSPDFQDTLGYPKDAPKSANMSIAANWLGEQFNTLSYTIEMPFKDNADLPNNETGWSADRSAKLGADVLFPIHEVLKTL